MSSRVEVIAALYTRAHEAGWQTVEHDDDGIEVVLYLEAENASQQMVQGLPRAIPGQLKKLGGPEDYPLDENYDLPSEKQVAVMAKMVAAQDEAERAAEMAEMAEVLAEDEENETVQAVAKALDIRTVEAADQLAYEENDPEWAKEWQELLAEEAAAGEAERIAEVQKQAEQDELHDRSEAHAAREVRESEYATENPQTADEEDYAEFAASAREELQDEIDEALSTAGDGDAVFPTADEERPEHAGDDWAEAVEALRLAAERVGHDRYVLQCKAARIDEALDRALSRNVVQDENEHVGVDGLHEDISPFGPTLKELWRNEAPRPEQFLPEVYDMGERSIIARKGDEVRVFNSQVAAGVKAGLEADGFEFFHTTKARANELARTPKIAAQRAGRMVTKTVGGREVAPEGWKIRVSGNGLPVQFFKSVNESAWEGLSMRLVRWA